MGASVQVTSLSFLLIFVNSVHSKDFIVDLSTPIVLSHNDSETFFGYSLTHMDSFGGTSQHSSSSVTLFIGAPKDTVQNNSGVVWSCKFRETADISCSILNDISQQVAPPPPNGPCKSSKSSSTKFPESENDQWIGATLSASNSTLYACAPRWKRNGRAIYNKKCGGQTAVLGACYEAYHDKHLKVELDNVLDKQGGIHFGEYGLASHITPATGNRLVAAPTYSGGMGMFIEVNGKKKEYHNWRREYIHEKNSYLGYSVTSGRSSESSYYVAAGAPRAESLYGLVTVSPSMSRKLIGKLIGKQFGGYFGYSLATVDLNGDGSDELLVGAPMHTLDEENDFSSGCVFIYDVTEFKDGNPFKHELCPKNNWLKRVSKGARFGSTMVNLGDLNFDGVDDFAIAAPYDDNEIGTVFIFHGMKGNDFSHTPAQVVRGRSMRIAFLRGFGNSLYKVDIDGNGTPDLAIGTFTSGHVAVVRTRPIAKPILKVTFYDESSAQRIYNFKLNQDKFRIKVCVNFRFSIDLPKETQLTIKAWFRWEIDPRFIFDDRKPAVTSDDLSSIEETCVFRPVSLVNPNSPLKVNMPIQFQASLWYNETVSSESVQPASLQLSSKLGTHQEIKMERTYKQIFQRFSPYNPAPIPETMSGWHSLVIANDNCKNLECDPALDLRIQIFHEDGHLKEKQYSKDQYLVIGQLDTLVLKLVLYNTGETAYNPVVKVTFIFTDEFNLNTKEPISLEWTQMPDKHRQCTKATLSPFREETTFQMITMSSCSKPLQTMETLIYTLKLGLLKQIKIKDKLKGSLKVKVEAYPDGQQQKENIAELKEIRLEGQVKLDVTSTAPHQTEVNLNSGVVDLAQLYTITNSKKSATSAKSVKVEISIPAYSKLKDKHVELGIANPSNLEMDCVADNFIFYDPNSLGFSLNDTTFSNEDNYKSRPARSTKDLSRETKLTGEKSPASSHIGKVLVLSGCGKACSKITCYTFMKSEGSREIQIQMYLLPSAIEKLINEKVVGIQVDSSMTVSFLKEKVTKSGSTSRSFIQVKPVSWYIYIAAGGGGIFLLIIVIFVLCKCGFFRRKKKEELKEIKRKTLMLTEDDLKVLSELEAAIEREEEAQAQKANEDSAL